MKKHLILVTMTCILSTSVLTACGKDKDLDNDAVVLVDSSVDSSVDSLDEIAEDIDTSCTNETFNSLKEATKTLKNKYEYIRVSYDTRGITIDDSALSIFASVQETITTLENLVQNNITEEDANGYLLQINGCTESLDRLGNKIKELDNQSGYVEEDEEYERVIVLKNNTNIRAAASTDSEVIGTANKGDTFNKIKEIDGWTEIQYLEGTAYIRNGSVMVRTEDSDTAVLEAYRAKQEELQRQIEEEKKRLEEEERLAEEEKNNKKEESEDDSELDKVKEEIKHVDPLDRLTKQNDEIAEENKKYEEEKKKEEEERMAREEEQRLKIEEEIRQRKEREQLEAQQKQLESIPATGRMPASGAWSYQGVTFSAAQVAYFHQLWDYTGDAAEMVTHHSAGELQQVCNVAGIR